MSLPLALLRIEFPPSFFYHLLPLPKILTKTKIMTNKSMNSQRSKTSLTIPKQFHKQFPRIPKKFQKNSEKFKNSQKFPKNSQKNSKILKISSSLHRHLEAKTPFGLVSSKNHFSDKILSKRTYL